MNRVKSTCFKRISSKLEKKVENSQNPITMSVGLSYNALRINENTQGVNLLSLPTKRNPDVCLGRFDQTFTPIRHHLGYLTSELLTTDWTR